MAEGVGAGSEISIRATAAATAVRATSRTTTLRPGMPPLPRPWRALWLLGQPLVRWWLTRRYHVTVDIAPEVRRLRGPWLLVSNHVAIWDFLLIASLLPRYAYFVAADGNFRSRMMRFLMRIGGALPKVKARTDVMTLRMMQTLIARREIVMVFPEGQRSWDGRTRELLPGIGKLARLLGAPVVAVHLSGAYASRPRWSARRRRGRVHLSMRVAATVAELRAMTAVEADARIVGAITHDEDAWLAESGVAFHARDRAECAETVLFWCPACGAWDSITSRGAEIACGACGHTVRLTPGGTLVASAGTRRREASPAAPPAAAAPHPRTIAEWNARQLAVLRAVLGTVPPPSPAPPPLPVIVPDVEVLTGRGSRPLHPRGHGPARLDERGLHIPFDGRTVCLAPSQWSGITVQYTYQLELYAHGILWIVRTVNAAPSAYRLEETMLALAAAR